MVKIELTPQSVFITVVGLVTQLPQEFYTFLLEVQNKLAKIIKSVGKIDHVLYPFLFTAARLLVIHV